MSRRCVAALLALGLSSAALAAYPWVGKHIVLKRLGVTASSTEDGKGSDAPLLLPSQDYTVLEERNDRLQVNCRGKIVWLDRTDAILVSESVPYFTERIRLDPKDGHAYAARASGWAFRKDLEKAIQDYDEAIRLVPDNPVYRAYRGYMHFFRKDLDRAIADCDQTIRLMPNATGVYFVRGDCRRQKGDYDGAIKDFDIVIQQNPNSPNAYCNRGMCYAAKQHYGHAIEDYSEAIRLDPKSELGYIGYFDRGNAYRATRKYEQAISDYRTAIRLNPTHGPLYEPLARLLATCKQEDVRDGKAAIELAKKSCELTAYKDMICIEVLAAAYAEVGQFDEAIKWQKRVLEDAAYEKAHGDDVRDRLRLYEQGQPYRE